MQPPRILFVATSQEKMGYSNQKTGLWLHDLAIPYYIFKEAGASIILASPKGGPVPLDPKSESIIAANSTTKRFLRDPDTINLLNNSAKISEEKAEHFDFVFLTGGHGSMWDFPDNDSLKSLLEEFNFQGKFIGAVGHGVAGLLNLETSPEIPLLRGRQVSSYSNSEEQVSGLAGTIPFLLESSLVSRAALYTSKPNFLSHMVMDGNIITGQNSTSAREVAMKLLFCFKEKMRKS
jgi:putative intracellular protease/amidase